MPYKKIIHGKMVSIVFANDYYTTWLSAVDHTGIEHRLELTLGQCLLLNKQLAKYIADHVTISEK
jgi:hypothetical protein